MAVRVSEGTVNAHTTWVLTTPKPITVGGTALTYQPMLTLYAFSQTELRKSGAFGAV
jgi:hypothetical protein